MYQIVFEYAENIFLNTTVNDIPINYFEIPIFFKSKTHEEFEKLKTPNYAPGEKKELDIRADVFQKRKFHVG